MGKEGVKIEIMDTTLRDGELNQRSIFRAS